MESVVDIIGIDLYPRQYAGTRWKKPYYRGPSQSDKELTQIITTSEKPVWITELQAEPWEADDEAYRSQNPQSYPRGQCEKNIAWANQFPVEQILLWGSEYWHYSTST